MSARDRLLAPRAGTGRLPRVLPAARGQSGQATVELVALLPIAALVVAAAFHVLAAGRAAEAAGAAAEAGAVALLQDRDAQAAIRNSLDGWPRRAFRFRIAGRRVSVTVRPRGARVVADRLTATAVAYAGAAVHPHSRSLATVRGGDGALGAGL